MSPQHGLPEELSISLESVDRHFADFIFGLPGLPTHELWTGAALASQATHLGHICADLSAVARDSAGRPIPSKGGPIDCPKLEQWLARLRGSEAVGSPGELKPLILDESSGAARLYLYRYWQYERALAEFLRNKAAERLRVADPQRLAEGLTRLFPQAHPGEIDGQRIAAAVALSRRLAILTGGPGTGKTSTVVRILALLLELSGGAGLRIALAAPTAKAAARLKEAVHAERNTLPCPPEILSQLPGEAATLHRLLGYRPDSTQFRYGSENRLPLDGCFEALNRFRILCAVTQGASGVEAVNALTARLHRKIPGTPAARRWYPGQPLLITANDYAIRLFNGDVGVIYPEGPEAFSSGLRVHFATGGGKYRKILPQRLPEHLPVYATTVHRSQGSEYQEVVLMLPDRPSPVLTRELLYTAITRARRRVEIWGRQELFLKAVETRIERSSGLQSLMHDACRVSPT